MANSHPIVSASGCIHMCGTPSCNSRPGDTAVTVTATATVAPLPPPLHVPHTVHVWHVLPVMQSIGVPRSPAVRARHTRAMRRPLRSVRCTRGCRQCRSPAEGMVPAAGAGRSSGGRGGREGGRTVSYLKASVPINRSFQLEAAPASLFGRHLAKVGVARRRQARSCQGGLAARPTCSSGFLQVIHQRLHRSLNHAPPRRSQ